MNDHFPYSCEIVLSLIQHRKREFAGLSHHGKFKGGAKFVSSDVFAVEAGTVLGKSYLASQQL